MATRTTGQVEAGGEPRAAPEFDAGSLAKSLLRATAAGALATLDADGAPFSTLTTVATDVDGRPLLLLSRLAAHTRHLEVDGRCSLLLARIGRGDPLAHPRLTLNAMALRLDRASADGVRARQRFLKHHPKAELYADFGDFSFWRLDPVEGHLNGGFARAAKLPGRELLTDVSRAQALIAAEEEALAHMNADHAEAIGLYATALLGAEAGRWRLVGIDPEGCDLACGDERRRLAFPRPLDTPEELRAMLAALAKEARAKAAGREAET
ncbi:MAG: HugZ family protein [Hyphomicrobiales bacterium]